MKTFRRIGMVMAVALLSELFSLRADELKNPAPLRPGEVVFSETFEDGREAWRSTTVGVLDQRPDRQGMCLKLVDQDRKKYVKVSQRISIQPDSQYKVTFHVFSLNAGNAGLWLTEDRRVPASGAYERVNTYFITPYRQGAAPGRWEKIEFSFTASLDSTALTLGLCAADGNVANTGTVWFDDITLTYLGPRPKNLAVMRKVPPLPETPPAEESLPLPLLEPLVLDTVSPGCRIVCPDLPGLTKAADELATVIEKKTGRRPPVLVDAAPPERLGRGPLLIMGNLVAGAAARRLYLAAYDFTDCAWPGRGGFVVRTIRDPFGSGAHVLLMGGSTEADIASAAREAGRIVNEKGHELGFLNLVKLGANADAIRPWSEAYLTDDDAVWRRVGGCGCWDYMHRIGRTGLGFLRTGDEAYLPHFKRELLRFFDENLINVKGKRKQRRDMHSVIDEILLPWDLLADHPFFTPETRRDIDAKFLHLACSREGGRRYGSVGWGVRGNHGLGWAWDCYLLGRYFQRRYGIEEGRKWMLLAANYFAPQLCAAKPGEDNYGHQFSSSLVSTLNFAFATGNEEYLTSSFLRDAVDRAIAVYPVGTGAFKFLCASAVALNDPRCLSRFAYLGTDEFVRACAGMRGSGMIGECFRGFCGFAEPSTREDLTGVFVAPLDPFWYAAKSQNVGHTQYRTVPVVQDCFDKVTFRDGFSKDDFFMMIDGLCGGGHSFEDANCIVQYRDRGLRWLRSQSYTNAGPTCSTVRQQNGVFVGMDGHGRDGVHRCARLLYVRKLPGGYDAVGTALSGLGDVDWERHVVRKKEAWTLVIDRATARKSGEVLMERHWHVNGAGFKLFPDGLSSWYQLRDDRAAGAKKKSADFLANFREDRRSRYCFHLQSAGLPPEQMSGTTDRKEAARLRLASGGAVEIATLMFTNEDPDERSYRLEKCAGGWLVRGTKRTVVIATSDKGTDIREETASVKTSSAPQPDFLPLRPTAPAITLPWQRLSLGSTVTAVAVNTRRVAAGTRSGLVVVADHACSEIWRAKRGSEVLSLHFVDQDLMVGEDDGTLSRFDASGRQKWRLTIPYVVRPFEHWTDRRSRIHEIASGDMDGDGQQEVFVGNGDGRVHAFSGDGRELWKEVVKWGIYNAMTPTRYQGGFALFGGARGPTLCGRLIIFGPDGDEVGRLSCSTMESQRIRDVRLVDLDGDGKREILCARDINCLQMICCNEDRIPIWQTDVGGTPWATTVREMDGQCEVVVASLCGYIHALNGADGTRKWVRYIGDEAHFLWARRDGTLLAICPSGMAFVLGRQGELVGAESLGTTVTALLRPGDHRIAPPAVPVGTEDGFLRVLRPEKR